MKTNDKIEVKKIDIKIGDNTISLKPEQAKELKKILNEMFEESHDKTIHHYWWNYPIYTQPWTPNWTITCGGTSYVDSTSACSTTNAVTGNVTLCLNAA